MIVDAVGSICIEHCIPSKALFSVLPVRNIIPYIIKIDFFLNLIKYLIKTKNAKESIVFAIVDTLDPKVAISFIDNARIMGLIHASFPNILCISVQNGIRTDVEIGGFSKINIDTFYGFGIYEKFLLKSNKIEVKKYVNSGSLRYCIFKKNFYKKNKKRHNICYLSEFSDTNTVELKVLRQCSEVIFLSLINYCTKFDRSLSVAMRSELNSDGFKSEKMFYQKMDLGGIAEIVPNKVREFGSYNIAFNSDIVVCTLSTLGFEMMGAGKKVLFGASLNNSELLKLFNSIAMFKELPSAILIKNKESIYNKIENLLGMSHQEYLEITHNARLYNMDNTSGHFPDELIKNRILSCIND